MKLPFLSVDVPLTTFFWLGPLLLLVVHAYVLLHFSMLAGKAVSFREGLERPNVSDTKRAQLRLQLPGNIFVQIAAGPDDVRKGFKSVLLQWIAWISLVIGPLGVLVLFLLQFLPYHHEIIAWCQRMMVVLDLLLLWWLWPEIARGENGMAYTGQASAPQIRVDRPCRPYNKRNLSAGLHYRDLPGRIAR